jgi:2-polyprenyl-3-methyl-5-hydroxy-6-metoxy-1,4-benzoquinol methylase
MTNWDEVNEWERQWWGDCTNTFAEETKQITYAHRMGLQNVSDGAHWPYYDLAGKSVLDIGGGPTSMLLKCHSGGLRVVVDPCRYPDWVRTRYEVAGITYVVERGEDIDGIDQVVNAPRFDEAWIYNVLQHTDDPERIVRHARTYARSVRLFEWVDIPPHHGHPSELRADRLSEWLGGYGTVEDMRRAPENGCNEKAYYGVFSGY